MNSANIWKPEVTTIVRGHNRHRTTGRQRDGVKQIPSNTQGRQDQAKQTKRDLEEALDALISLQIGSGVSSIRALLPGDPSPDGTGHG